MKLLAEAYGPNEYFLSGNGQEVRELILRQAVKSCDSYSTDILIFFGNINILFKENYCKVTLYFRNFGVDWDEKPNFFRYKMVLEKRNANWLLFGETGNC